MAEAAMQNALSQGLFVIGSEQDFREKIPNLNELFLGSVVPSVKDILDTLLSDAMHKTLRSDIYKGSYNYLVPIPRPETLTDDMLKQLKAVRFGLLDGSLETGVDLSAEK